MMARLLRYYHHLFAIEKRRVIIVCWKYSSRHWDINKWFHWTLILCSIFEVTTFAYSCRKTKVNKVLREITVLSGAHESENTYQWEVNTHKEWKKQIQRRRKRARHIAYPRKTPSIYMKESFEVLFFHFILLIVCDGQSFTASFMAAWIDEISCCPMTTKQSEYFLFGYFHSNWRENVEYTREFDWIYFVFRVFGPSPWIHENTSTREWYTGWARIK